MDHLIEQCSGIANSARLNRKFHIVVVYETFVSAARALRACEILRQEIPPDVSVRINAWRIESLEDAAECDLAASSAALADLVILSTPGRDGPPPALKQWIDRWLDHRIQSPSALFALFGDHLSPVATATASALLQKTSPLGVDFFMHPTPSLDFTHRKEILGWDDNCRMLPNANGSYTCTHSHDNETAFDTIESFAAHLRAQFFEMTSAELPGEMRRGLQTAF